MSGKRSELQRVIDTLIEERAQLTVIIDRLLHARDAKPTRKPRKARAEKVTQP